MFSAESPNRAFTPKGRYLQCGGTSVKVGTCMHECEPGCSGVIHNAALVPVSKEKGDSVRVIVTIRVIVTVRVIVTEHTCRPDGEPS